MGGCVIARDGGMMFGLGVGNLSEDFVGRDPCGVDAGIA